MLRTAQLICGGRVGTGSPRILDLGLARNRRDLRSAAASLPASEIMAAWNRIGTIHLRSDGLFCSRDGRLRCTLFLRLVRLDGPSLSHGGFPHRPVRRGASANGGGWPWPQWCRLHDFISDSCCGVACKAERLAHSRDWANAAEDQVAICTAS